MTAQDHPSDIDGVLATLHRNASAMAAGPHPPARIRLGVGAVTLEWDLVPTPVAAPVAVPAAPIAAPASPDAAAAPAAPAASADPAPAGHVLTAPTVGVFYRAPEPGASPFVDTGDLVSAGQQVGIVEAMKLMIPVEADRGGRVAEVLCADATGVEYGAPLFALADVGA